MKQLSEFTEAINQRFGSNVAIPKGKDYGYLRRLFREDFDSVMENFKTSVLSNGDRLISDVNAVSYPTGYSLNDKQLFFIDFTDHDTREKLVKFDTNKNLPPVKFTRTEFESAALFHELGHSMDDQCKYYDLDEDRFDSLRWQRECFADLFSAMMLAKCTNSVDIINDRLIPLRALGLTPTYHTMPALKMAIELSRSHDLSRMSEKDVIKLATTEWNNLTCEDLLAWREASRMHSFNLNVMVGCVKSGNISNFLEQFETQYHQKIVNNFSGFMQEYMGKILTNAFHFDKPIETVCKVTLCLLRPLGESELNLNRYKTYDQALTKYLESYPECPIGERERACQNPGIAI